MQLEAEIDYNHAPGVVTLWVFQRDGESRVNLSTQRLYNFAQRVRWGMDQGFNEQDEMLLQLLWPVVSKPHIVKGNLKAVKIPKRSFDAWLGRFEDAPDRFLDRATAASVSQELAQGQLRFRLQHRGQASEVAAEVALADGQVFAYHELKHVPKGRQSRYVCAGKTLAFEFVVARELLDQLFGNRAPVVPNDRLVKNLGEILNGRLDLLCGDVDHVGQEAPVTIALEEDGADILLSVQVGDQLVSRLDLADSSRLRLRGRRFEVLHYRADVTPVAAILKRASARSEHSKFRIGGKAENLVILGDGLDALPREISVRRSRALAAFVKPVTNVSTELSVVDGGSWADVHLACTAEGLALDADQLASFGDGGHRCFRTAEGKWLRVSAAAAAAFRKRLSGSGLRLGRQRMPRCELRNLSEMVADLPDVRKMASAKQLLAQVQAQPVLPPFTLADTFAGELRPYQREGCEFLHTRLGAGVSCLLADDMGLGKTVQVLAYLQAHRARTLVVCPASLIFVWAAEAAKFAPDLDVVPLLGSPEQRAALLGSETGDLLLCTYAVLRNDIRQLSAEEFALVVFDEAQQLKNPDAGVSQAARRLRCQARVAVTGTPLENRLRDLWSIMDLLNPGYLGDRASFEDRTACSAPARERLRQQIAPLIVRRTKEEVAPELPARTEEVLAVAMTDEQRILYTAEQQRARDEGGGAMQIFAKLTRLRQVCCHPALLAGQGGESGKLALLLERLEELRDAGHSALVFSQFTSMLELIELALQRNHIQYEILTGETSAQQRQARVQRFQKSDIPMVFLLSLRAAGTGLTLTKAEYVFLYDPWWNPAVEQQAIDRAHRIGQDKPVVAYRLVAADSIEERVLKMQQEKRELFAQVVEGAAVPAGLEMGELLALLA